MGQLSQAGASAAIEQLRQAGAEAGIVRTADARFDNLPGHDVAPNYLDVDGLRMH
jgi:hypothetical protein